MCGPLLSRNSSTDNLLLKITAPKRTGRKRKRGTGGPFVGDHLDDSEVYQDDINLANIRSRARLDHPTQLLRTLQDNVGRYDVEVVARVDHTHRFRGKNISLANTMILIRSFRSRRFPASFEQHPICPEGPPDCVWSR